MGNQEKDERGQSPEEVGETMKRRGRHAVKDEGKEAGRDDPGKKGQSQRPPGKSTWRDPAGINPSQRD